MSIVNFPLRSRGKAAHFVRATPLYDEVGRQVGIAAPGQPCEVLDVYKWQPGPGSPVGERFKIIYRGVVHDVDKGAVWVE